MPQTGSTLAPDAPDHWPALMARAQAGDGEAYNRVLRQMVPAIRAMARRRLRDEALVEDIVQDVLLTVHRVRHTYDPARPIMPWLSALTAARSVDAMRRRGRNMAREVYEEEHMLAWADAGATERMEGFAARHEVERMLGALPARQREVVELVRLREMSLADTAAATRLSVPAIKALLHRALARLRQNGGEGHD